MGESRNLASERRSAFTIVELLIVISIIAILAGAITMGVNGMFYKSRLAKAKAMRSMLQSGLETYYARKGEWPSPIRGKVDETDGKNEYVELSSEDADKCFREIVKVSSGQNANPVIDPTGLFVAENVDKYGCTDIHKAWAVAQKLGIVSATDHKCDGKCRRGIAFQEATNKKSARRIPLSQMNFGYPGPNNGRFCRFRLYYYPKSDTVKVYLQKANEHYSPRYRNGFTDE